MAYTPFGHSMRTSPAELRRHRQREEARRAILDATEALLLEAGSDGFSMRRPVGPSEPPPPRRAPPTPPARRSAPGDPRRHRGAAPRGGLRRLLHAAPRRALRLYDAHHLPLLRGQAGADRRAARGAIRGPPAARAARAAPRRPGRAHARALPRVRRLRDAQSHVLPAPHHAPARGGHAPAPRPPRPPRRRGARPPPPPPH